MYDGYLTNEYTEDVRQAAQSNEAFDKINSKIIGQDHGEDPRQVLQDIRDLRREFTKVQDKIKRVVK